MGASWSTRDFRQTGVTPSGPGEIFPFLLPEDLAHLVFADLNCRCGGEVGGLVEVLMVLWRGVQGECGVFFQICNRTHSDHLPVVDSPQCWGMVSCNWWCLSYLYTLKQNHWKRIGTLVYRNKSSLLICSPFPVCIWPVYTRLCPLSCKHLLWPEGAIWVLQWTMVCHCCRLNESW